MAATVRTEFGTEALVETQPIASFYRHGWHSWSPSGWVDPDATVSPIPDEGRRLGHDDPLHAFDTTVSGSGVGLAAHDDGSVTLLGSLDAGARVAPEGSGLIGTAESPVDWLIASGGESDVWRAYTDLLRDRYERRGGRPVRVWCSWYSFYEDVTEEAMHRVLADLDDLPFEVVQVDDGWERAIGDWQPNAKFPSGMAAMAEEIRSRGFTPGLWLAPLIAQSTSDLAAERPELLLRTEDGSPVVAGINWGSPYYALDPTSDATLAFLREVITTARGWGYDYLKLDFLYAAAFPGAYTNPMPREQAYRLACEAIREAAGDDCYLLACGAPIIASLGIFDGIRIGPDVAQVWEMPELTAIGDESGEGARNALATSTDRLWLREVIDVDPDVVYFRGDTELDERTLAALRDLASICEFVGVSDPPEVLTTSQRADLAQLLEAASEVSQIDRYRWAIDGRPVDFGWVRTVPSPFAGSAR